MQDVRPVTDAQRLLHVVVGDEDGDSIGGEFSYFVLEFFNRVRVNGREWLIEQHQLWFRDERPRNFKPASFAAGTRRGKIIGLVREPELREEFVGASFTQPSAHALCFENRKQVLPNAQLLKHARLLAEVSHPRQGVAIHREPRDIIALKVNGACLRRDHADRHAEARRLARAVSAEQPDDFADADIKAHPVDDAAISVLLDKVFRDKEFHADIVPGRARSCSVGPEP